MERYDRRANTILLVDDDDASRRLLRGLFSKAYAVREAETGHQAVEAILVPDSRLCAILLDAIVPGMDGIEVLRRLKPSGVAKRIPVFLITAEADEWLVKTAYDLGVVDVMRKPVVPYVVMRRVESVIELFEARKQLRFVVASQHAELLDQAQKIIQLNQGMIEALATAIEFRNEEAGGHVQRISRITRIMLERTEFGEGLSPWEIDDIAMAAIMHDVGKITIPDAVLTKPGRLTAEEFEVMKTHTVNGVAILESIPQLRDGGAYGYACDIARHHHERWDGRGYPDGLAGDEISPWAQVVSVADVYDALSCKRVYKPSLSRKVVLEMIRTGQCGAFNPRLLDSFFSVEEQLSGLYKNLDEARNF